MPGSSTDTKRPTVSIILPTYNRERFLPDAFAAIRAQTFTDWELIVVDDGSTDGTRDIVPRLTADFPQPVRYIYQQNQGAYGARNTGLDHATGKYIAFYDSDDLWLPHHLKDCVEALEANPDVDWVYGACRVVDGITGEELAPNTFYVDGEPRPFLKLRVRQRERLRIVDDRNSIRCQIKGGLMCGFQCSVMRSRLFESLRIPAFRVGEDRVLPVHVLIQGARLAYLDEVHVVYRVHDSQTMGASADGNLAKWLGNFEELVRGYQSLLAISGLSAAERRSVRRRLSEELFWHAGYATLWMKGRRAEALQMFCRALRYWPWNLAYWKTIVVSLCKAQLPKI